MYELLTAWAVGISGSLVAFTVFPAALLILTALAGYAGLRELRVAPAVSVLGVAAVVLAPQAVGWQATGAVTDPAALCWVVCCGALSAGSVRRPAAYPLALIAGALAVSTKFTAAPLTVAASSSPAWRSAAGFSAHRGRWRPGRRWPPWWGCSCTRETWCATDRRSGRSTRRRGETACRTRSA
jgi:hypothetical protein